jgi:hypothetical protein
MELLSVFSPELLGEQFLQARQTNLEGVVQEYRQFGWMHPMILDAIESGEKLA